MVSLLARTCQSAVDGCGWAEERLATDIADSSIDHEFSCIHISVSKAPCSAVLTCPQIRGPAHVVLSKCSLMSETMIESENIYKHLAKRKVTAGFCFQVVRLDQRYSLVLQLPHVPQTMSTEIPTQDAV